MQATTLIRLPRCWLRKRPAIGAFGSARRSDEVDSGLFEDGPQQSGARLTERLAVPFQAVFAARRPLQHPLPVLRFGSIVENHPPVLVQLGDHRPIRGGFLGRNGGWGARRSPRYGKLVSQCPFLRSCRHRGGSADRAVGSVGLHLAGVSAEALIVLGRGEAALRPWAIQVSADSGRHGPSFAADAGAGRRTIADLAGKPRTPSNRSRRCGSRGRRRLRHAGVARSSYACWRGNRGAGTPDIPAENQDPPRGGGSTQPPSPVPGSVVGRFPHGKVVHKNMFGHGRRSGVPPPKVVTLAAEGRHLSEADAAQPGRRRPSRHG